jgi:hypothetical protein
MSRQLIWLVCLAGCSDAAPAGKARDLGSTVGDHDGGGARDQSVPSVDDLAQASGDLLGRDLLGSGSAGDASMSEPPPDLAEATCTTLPDEVTQWIGAHLSCVHDSDCVDTKTACGLSGSCGVAINNAGVDGLKALVLAWVDLKCSFGHICEPCPIPPRRVAVCKFGVCAEQIQ